MDLDRWMLIGEAPAAAPGEISVPTVSGSAATTHRPAGSALASGDGQRTGTPCRFSPSVSRAVGCSPGNEALAVGARLSNRLELDFYCNFSLY
jgi:hypothetical protein